jgi:putative ABC transport system ATP-binding protein
VASPLTERTQYLYEATNLCKAYGQAENRINALAGVTFRIECGDFVAVTGPSGSGKSTLLGLLGLGVTPSEGSLLFAGQDVRALDHTALAGLRNSNIGFVFQSFQLLPRVSALENVELPLVYSGIVSSQRRGRAEEALEKVGLAQRMRHLPSQLSGGEQQRVAIARAMVNQPRVILADEPTGALDTRTGEDILALLWDLNAQGTAVVIITHNTDIAESIGTHMVLTDGRMTPVEGNL